MLHKIYLEQTRLKYLEMHKYLYNHGQLVNTAPKVTLNGWFLTGRSSVKYNIFVFTIIIKFRKKKQFVSITKQAV